MHFNAPVQFVVKAGVNVSETYSSNEELLIRPVSDILTESTAPSKL